MNSKKWSLGFLVLSLALLLSAALLTGAVDPFFHYHAPLESLQYPLNSERYQNYGILKNFSYDTMLTGSSMTQNFRASECDALFDAKTVKTPMAGGTFLEFHNMLQHAIDANPQLERILLGLDAWLLFEDKDTMRDGEVFPEYLYDRSPFNDVEYLLNKHILCQNTLGVLEHTWQGLPTTNFDDYSFWATSAVFSRDALLATYNRPEKSPAYSVDYFLENTRDTVTQNLLPLIESNPDIQFYIFFTPYSILNMDSLNQGSLLSAQFEACQITSELLLAYDNVHLFSFFNDYETITNLDHYFDPLHYSDAVNSLMLQRMARGEYALTKETCAAHWDTVRSYYLSYDYDAIFIP